VKALEGIITANVDAKAKQSVIDRGDYEQVDMKGDMQLENLVYQAEGLPDMRIKSVQMEFSPRFVAIENFDANLGSSDVKANGRIDNILAYFSPDKTMTGNMQIVSDYFNANEWLEEEASATEVTAAVPENEEEMEVFDRFDFNISAKVKKMDYDVYRLNNTVLAGQVSPNSAKIKDFRTEIGKSDIKAKGQINHIFDYLFANQILTGNIQLNSNVLDLNELMAMLETTPGAQNTADEVPEGYPVPENIQLDMNANIGELRYTNMELRNINGKARVVDQQLKMNGIKANTLGGQIQMDGSYDTRKADKPLFDMKYKVSQFDFRKAFNTLNTFQQLAPVAKFIEGKFNSTLEFKGALGKDMMPDLSTLTASGFLQTLDGLIRNFKPLESLGQQLNIDYFRSVKIKNTKNWFEIADGKVVIKPFDFNYKDIAMRINGSHGVNLDMDYLIKAKIPRELLEKNAVGSAANKGWGMLNNEAQKVGLDLKQAEFINVDIALGGTMTDPKLSFKPTGTDGQSLKENLSNKVNEAKEEVVNEAKDKVNEQTEKAKDKGKEVAEDLKNQGKNALDSVVADPGKAKDKVEDVLKGGEKSVEDAAKDLGGEVGEEAKEGLNKLKDRFKRKKKKKGNGGG
ncbi:MAG: AsmA-like C-terminal region-containing protein, partial [Bacteroidota bacterium]